MSNGQHRRNTLLVSLNSLPSWGASYTVTAYEPGAQVESDSNGTAITVRAGHGFAAGDKLMVGTDTTKYRTIQGSPAATSIDVNAPVTVAANQYLVNLGPDNGTTTPQYDGSGRSIYQDSDTAGTPIGSSQVTADAQGVYSYWHDGFEIWELARNAAGTPVALIPGASGGNIRAANSGDLFLYRNDTIKSLQITGQVESSAVAAGSYYGRVPTAAVGINAAIPFVLGQDNVLTSPGSFYVFDLTGQAQTPSEFTQVQGQSYLDLAANGGAGGKSFLPFEQSSSATVGPSVAQTSQITCGRFTLIWSATSGATPPAFAGIVSTCYALWGRWIWSGTATNTGSVTTAAGVAASLDLTSGSGAHIFAAAHGLFSQVQATAVGTNTVTLLTGANITVTQTGAGMASTSIRGLSSSVTVSAGTVTTLAGQTIGTTLSGAVNPTTGYGSLNTVNKASSGTTTNLFGGYIDWNLSSTGTVTTGTGVRMDMTLSAAGTITTGRTLHLNTPSNSGAGTWTTHYQLDIGMPTTGFGTGTTLCGLRIGYPTTQSAQNIPHVQMQLVAKDCAATAPTSVLPTAAVALEGSVAFCTNTNAAANDGLWVCKRTGAGTYAWVVCNNT